MDISDIKSILANEGDLMDSEVLEVLGPSADTLIEAAKTDLDNYEAGKVDLLSHSAQTIFFALEQALETKRFREKYYG